MSSGSITNLYNRLQQGERDSVQKLWELYFRRLVGLARKKLGDVPRHGADEEDVALSAFDSFCRGAEQGRFPQLADRDDLWQLLARSRRARRPTCRNTWAATNATGVGSIQAGMGGKESALDGSFLSQLLSPEPDPAFAAEVAEECRRLLDALQNEELRQIALRKMEGYTNEEIAAQQARAPWPRWNAG